MSKVKVPKLAVENARKGLDRREEFPDSEKPSLSPQEAKEKGIHSGITTSQTLIRSDCLSREMAERIIGFLSRTEDSSYTDRENVARMIWGEFEDDDANGGRTFLQYLQDKVELLEE